MPLRAPRGFTTIGVRHITTERTLAKLVGSLRGEGLANRLREREEVVDLGAPKLSQGRYECHYSLNSHSVTPGAGLQNVGHVSNRIVCSALRTKDRLLKIKYKTNTVRICSVWRRAWELSIITIRCNVKYFSGTYHIFSKVNPLLKDTKPQAMRHSAPDQGTIFFVVDKTCDVCASAITAGDSQPQSASPLLANPAPPSAPHRHNHSDHN